MRRTLSILAILAAALAWSGSDVVQADAVDAEMPGSVRFVPHPGTTLTLEGHGPYRGTLDVLPGLTVVNDLPLEDYLVGVNEVPPAWPIEALKAQAVAARTYAIRSKAGGKWAEAGYDICPTTGCQVFSGGSVEAREHWERWETAVRETAGQVLLHGGAPILARYHASSGGRTVPNHIAYPGSAQLPYLVAVDDPYDAASPLHSWTVDIPTEAFAEILRYKLGWEGVFLGLSPFRGNGRVVVHYEHGDAEVAWSEIRRIVNEHAPAMAPGVYPGVRADGGAMPLTLPSARYDIHRTGSGIRFTGGGWGHGVGMSQWGAKGRADHGVAYPDILAAYYGGIRPEAAAPNDGIRVGVASGLGSISVSADGPFRVESGDVVLAEQGHGTWTATAAGGTVRVAGAQVLPEPEPEPEVVEAPALHASATEAAMPPVLPAAPASGGGPGLGAVAVFVFALAVVALDRGRSRLTPPRR